ncbi:hypothetical protein QJS10_CPB22g01195 [Acorus calamus]|uniref:Bifunctional inhibitor/plant lipid transfer protein/seed storage helical domain-containing protein n=1 Tax=Acorus calamus TaxID=4465 RepID=A0AAV9BYS3_ACOCL|nr:hypothetical protein QJS10_CPB22g01195 [Acorus calamus]
MQPFSTHLSNPLFKKTKNQKTIHYIINNSIKTKKLVIHPNSFFLAQTMARPSSSSALLVIILCFFCLSNLTFSDLASDRKECTQQLIGLSTCLNYIEGKAKTPPPDCCDGMKTVVQKSRKCLCVLVRDRNDPGLGFKIDPNLALSLPSICNAPANISECPTLLHLAPSSPMPRSSMTL